MGGGGGGGRGGDKDGFRIRIIYNIYIYVCINETILEFRRRPYNSLFCRSGRHFATLLVFNVVFDAGSLDAPLADCL